MFLGERTLVYGKINYAEFLIPRLGSYDGFTKRLLPTVRLFDSIQTCRQSDFNSVAPISPLTFFCAYTGAAVLRGLAVGLGVLISGFAFAPALSIASPILVLIFALLAAGHVRRPWLLSPGCGRKNLTKWRCLTDSLSCL